MAHFAELNEDSEVINVVVIDDQVLISPDATEKGATEEEQRGIDYLEKIFNHNRWVQTSYNDNMRNKFAQIGGTYDKEHDAFYEMQPWPSWAINHESGEWEAPVPVPSSVGIWTWNEDEKVWVKERMI